MSNVVDWGQAGNSGRGGGASGTFLRLKAGETVTVRLVGKPIEFHRYYVPGRNGDRAHSAITNGGDDCVIATKYNLNPSQRYAINVINRADGSLQVMEMPVTLYKDISNWAAIRGKDPGKNDGVDFTISVTRSNPSDPRSTRYALTPMDPAPFTDEEKELIGQGGSNLHNLLEIFKPTPQSEIEEKLGLVDAPAAAAASAPAGGESVDDDDVPF